LSHHTVPRTPERIWAADPGLELSHFTARRAFPLHFHAEGIVAVIVEGAEIVCVDGRPEIAEAGSIVVLESERPHLNEPITADGARYRGFYIDASLLSGAGDRRRLATHVLHNGRLVKELVDLHRSLEDHPSAEAVADAKRLVARVFDVVPPAAVTLPPPEELRAIAQVLRDRCAEQFVWADLANAVSVSPAHLARRFHAHFDVPPHLYQTQYRIARAKRLLQHAMPLSVTALECGFYDQSHFTHQFTRYVGQTPAAFARKQDFARS
jgi:AraC-like DNA-binding protein